MTETPADETVTEIPDPPGKKSPADDEATLAQELMFARHVAAFAWPFRGRFAATMLLTVGRALSLWMAVYLLYRVTSGLLPTEGPAPDNGSLLLAVAGLLLCQMGAAVFQNWGDESQRWFQEGVEVSVLQWTVQNLVGLPADYFRNQSLAQFVVRLEKLQLVVRAFLNCSLTLLSRSAAIVGILAGVLPLSPVLGSISAALLLLIAFLLWRRMGELRSTAKQELALDMGFADKVTTIFGNLRDLRSFGRQRSALAEFAETCEQMAARSIRMVAIYNGTTTSLHVGGIAVLSGMVAATLWMGTGLAGTLTCFAAMAMILDPLSEMLRTVTMLQSRMVKLGDLIDTIEELSVDRTRENHPLLTEPIERIQFANVGYQIGKARILEGIDFEMRRGEIIGIVGKSGAGKTTLARLLLGLDDATEGKILVNGRSLAEIDKNSHWRQTSYAAQVPCGMNGTIGEDVAFAAPKSSRREVDAALERAGIATALRDRLVLADQWEETEEGDAWDSRDLRQRMEWARVFLRGTNLIVLDEPTSMTEPAHEHRLLEYLREHRQRGIGVLISHRASTLAACDRIVVLHRGKMIDVGPRAAMIGRYFSEGEKPALRISA